MIKKSSSKKSSKKITEKPESRNEIKKSYYHCVSMLQKYASDILKESLYPNDNFSRNDIAFGLLENGTFLCVEDYPELRNKDKGYASHGLLLQISGFSDDMHDPKPRVDYRVRGIIKAEMGGSVVFWESSEDILEDNYKFNAVKKCLKELKKRNLIKNDTTVHGSGVGGKTALGLVESFLGKNKKDI